MNPFRPLSCMFMLWQSTLPCISVCHWLLHPYLFQNVFCTDCWYCVFLYLLQTKWHHCGVLQNGSISQLLFFALHQIAAKIACCSNCEEQEIELLIMHTHGLTLLQYMLLLPGIPHWLSSTFPMLKLLNSFINKHWCKWFQDNVFKIKIMQDDSVLSLEI